MIKQNLFLCLLFSALGGIAAILGSIALIIPHDREVKGLDVLKRQRWLGILFYVVFLGLNTTFYTFAPWYGPVSIYRPTALSAVLLSNLIIIGSIMRREKFDKDTQVATCVIALAVVLLPTVGPGSQEKQDTIALIQSPLALVCMCTLGVVFIISTLFMFIANLRTHQQYIVQSCLLGVSVSASVLSATISRAIGSIVSGSTRNIIIAAYVVIQLVWVYENAIEATAVESRVKFVPLYTCGSLLFNAIMGIIVWEDWRVVSSWSGYASAFLLMMLGVYLMSDLQFFGGKEKETGGETGKTQQERSKSKSVLMSQVSTMSKSMVPTDLSTRIPVKSHLCSYGDEADGKGNNHSRAKDIEEEICFADSGKHLSNDQPENNIVHLEKADLYLEEGFRDESKS